MLANLINLALSAFKLLSNTSNENPPEEQSPTPDTNNVAITLEAFYTDAKTGDDRRQTYAADYTNEILENSKVLLQKVNALLCDLGVISVLVSSGWRPPAVNTKVGGAAHSNHLIGKAVDLVDKTGELDKAISEKPELLRKHGLWLEDPSSTPGWTHLDFSDRADRPSRVFKP